MRAFESVIPLLRIYPKDIIRQVEKDPFIQLNSILFIILKNQKQSNVNLRRMDIHYIYPYIIYIGIYASIKNLNVYLNLRWCGMMFSCNVKWKSSLQQYTENILILNLEIQKCISRHIPTYIAVHRSLTTFHMWTCI